MSKVGAQLKKAREAADRTRAQVARDTGILIHQLAAIEYGNWDALPDDETVAGFVRDYAQYLGFVPEQPVADFWAERRVSATAGEATDTDRTAGASPETRTADADARPVSSPEKPAPMKSQPSSEADTGPGEPVESSERPVMGPRLLGALAILVVIVGVGWLLLRDRGGDPEPGDAEVPVADSVAEVGETAGETLDAVTHEAADQAPASTEEARATETTAESDPPAATAEPPTEPAPRAAPETRDAPAPSGDSALTVSEHGVGTGIRDRILVGRANRFPEGSQVVFWTRVVGGVAGDTVHHVWIHENGEVDDIPLRIGSAHWRTQSRKTLFDGSAGRWAVEARDADGRVLARSEFTCGE